MGQLDLLLGPSEEDGLEGNGFLSPFFGPRQGNRIRQQELPPSVGFLFRPRTISPLPVSPPPQAGTQASPPYYARFTEEQGFATDPAYHAATESRLPGLEDGPADA